MTARYLPAHAPSLLSIHSFVTVDSDHADVVGGIIFGMLSYNCFDDLSQHYRSGECESPEPNSESPRPAPLGRLNNARQDAISIPLLREDMVGSSEKYNRPEARRLVSRLKYREMAK